MKIYRTLRDWRAGARISAIVLAGIFMGFANRASARQSALQVPSSALPMTYNQAARDILTALRNDCHGELYQKPRIESGSLQWTSSVRTSRNGREVEGFATPALVRFADVSRVTAKNPAAQDALAKALRALGQEAIYCDIVTIELKSRKPMRFLLLYFGNDAAGDQFAAALDWFVAHPDAARSEPAISEQFTQQAGVWRALAVKPVMPEQAREHKVLAENAYQEKNFDKAIDEYEAALDVFPTWPEGQFNLALLCGETNYHCAVEHMQDYLELVPDAPDAQAAKDKIIIWRDKLNSSTGPPK